jgi:SAM-dependent methyltransferase
VFIQGRWIGRAVPLAVLLASSALAAHGQTRADCERQYTPQRAQEGKDVIWEPTEDSMVGPMLELAHVTAADKVYDLGAGDGKLVIAAAKQLGATGVGIEYDADLVKHARCLAAAEGVADRVTFIEGDIFESDFSDATVVTLYLTPHVNLRLKPMLLALKPGTRIVAYSFGIGGWEPEQQVDSFGDGSAFLFVVPAKAEGAWTFRPTSGGTSFVVELKQTLQMLEGSTADGIAVTGKLAGDAIELRFGQGAHETRVSGTVAGDRIVATVTRGDSSVKYLATRH